jgi:hypothetical protein
MAKMTNQDVVQKIKQEGLLPFLTEGDIANIEDPEISRLAHVARDAVLEIGTRLGGENSEWRDPLLDDVNIESVKNDKPGRVDQFLQESNKTRPDLNEPQQISEEEDAEDPRSDNEVVREEGRPLE